MIDGSIEHTYTYVRKRALGDEAYFVLMLVQIKKEDEDLVARFSSGEKYKLVSIE